ncbi:preprotein translocase subunit SecG [Falsiroseomonas bella]|uniref:Protein-export membrane protein SecG n=1 Tax=Falsiroseomonas bella TaxID=2184016 RepID=A0A317FAN9_9PROT|nr:preprotein translocase subunit SecG [Falsiroseomonas bella]PWS36134.1 preprotein translocase subunit SecG [Falsiroseomonas bella]
MNTVLLVLFLLVTLAMIGVILVQRSEGGGLGVGSSQGMGSFMSGRGTANLLTRTTAILGTAFMALALVLAITGKGRAPTGSILDAPATAPGTLVPGGLVPGAPAVPASPSVPTN